MYRHVTTSDESWIFEYDTKTMDQNHTLATLQPHSYLERIRKK